MYIASTVSRRDRPADPRLEARRLLFGAFLASPTTSPHGSIRSRPEACARTSRLDRPRRPSQMRWKTSPLSVCALSVVLYPSDANQAVSLLDAMREHVASPTCARPVRRRAIYGPGEGSRSAAACTAAPRRRPADADRAASPCAHAASAEKLAGKGHRGARQRPLLGQARDAVGDPRRVGGHRALVTVEDHWARRHVETVPRPRRGRLRNPPRPPCGPTRRRAAPRGPASPPPASTPTTSSRRRKTRCRVRQGLASSRRGPGHRAEQSAVKAADRRSIATR